MTHTGYIYNQDLNVVATITVQSKFAECLRNYEYAIKAKAAELGYMGCDEYGLTFTPAWDCEDGLSSKSLYDAEEHFINM